MRRLPESSSEDTGVKLPHTDTRSDIFDPVAEEELISKERLDDGW